MRLPRFHPLSAVPLFESQRQLRGHDFYPPANLLRALAPHDPRPAPGEAAEYVIYHSPWGHLVVTEIDPADLNGYGWMCQRNAPQSSGWGNLGYLGAFERQHGKPWEFWERDLYADDANAAAAASRILPHYITPVRHAPRSEPEPEKPSAVTPVPASTPAARVPRRSRGILGHR
ncbi:hypothetical protein [Streptomyces sp. 4F14]|uniref:hypothetical protein n=1 Tax=Streptomyces sp. 4F14 TaxID=3394380 RepID=UPI003A89FBA7